MMDVVVDINKPLFFPNANVIEKKIILKNIYYSLIFCFFGCAIFDSDDCPGNMKVESWQNCNDMCGEGCEGSSYYFDNNKHCECREE